MYTDYKKKFRKNVIKPGSTGYGVSGWKYHMDIPIPIFSAKVQRALQPEWNPEKDERLAQLALKISLEKSKPIPTLESAKEARDKLLEELRAEVKEIEDSRSKITEWEYLQIYRCIHGHGGLNGRHYFHYNFGIVVHAGESTASKPDLRGFDAYVFNSFQEAMDTSTGTAMVKRRRCGFSWDSVADDVYDMIFLLATNMFVSKDEEDQRKYFRRVKLYIENLPDFLRPKMVNDTIEFKSFAPVPKVMEVQGIDPEKAKLGELRSCSPKTVTAVEGATLNKLRIDEAGKIPNLRTLLQYGMPALAGKDGITRKGCLILGGTVGEMGVSGHVYKSIFNAPLSYEIIPMFVPGWMGAFLDEFGNDDEKRGTKLIKEKLAIFKAEGQLDMIPKYKQQFPLSIAEAWTIDDSNKLMPVTTLMQIKGRIEMGEMPPIKYGLLTRDGNGEIVLMRQEPKQSTNKTYPDHHGFGQVVILEDPILDSGWDTPYVCGCDPVDVNRDTFRELGSSTKLKYIVSDFAFIVYKRIAQIGGYSECPVAFYTGRPDNLDEAYEQAFLLASMYCRAPINLERQKGGRMEAYGRVRPEYNDLIMYQPGAALGHDVSDRWGHVVNEGWYSMVNGYMKDAIKKYHDQLWPIRLVDELIDWRERNTDLASSYASAVQLAREIDKREESGKSRMKAESNNSQFLHNLYQRADNGVVYPGQSADMRQGSIFLEQYKNRR